MYSLDEEEERKAVTGLSVYGSQPLRNPLVIGTILFDESENGYHRGKTLRRTEQLFRINLKTGITEGKPSG